MARHHQRGGQEKDPFRGANPAGDQHGHRSLAGVYEKHQQPPPDSDLLVGIQGADILVPTSRMSRPLASRTIR